MTDPVKTIELLYTLLTEEQAKKLKKLINEIEDKKTILKRPDGSVISGLEDGTDIIRIYGKKIAPEEFNFEEDQMPLKDGLIFLPEDLQLAEKKRHQMLKKIEIQYKIDRLNAEEGWVANWENENQNKYYIILDMIGNIIVDRDYAIRSQNQYMSKQTAETILTKYTQDELLQYLNIII